MKDFLKNILYIIYKLFTDHPKSIGESYFVHGLVAAKLAALSLFLFCIFLIHSIFPFLFKHIGCDTIEYIDSICNRDIKNNSNGWDEEDFF